jgi:putative redox protein
VRGHTVFVDQPVEDGGNDAAPTPTELFLAGLASCVAFYARRYLARHDIATQGFAVSLQYQMGSGPARVATAGVVLTPPPALPTERFEAFLAVASHCTVHNSLTQPPLIEVALAHPAAL